MITNMTYQSKTPTALIVGKKIVPEQPVFSYEDEKPPPFKIFAKKRKVEKSPPVNENRTVRHKLKSVSNRLPPKAPEKESKKTSVRVPNIRTPKPPLNKSFQRPRNTQKENVKESEKPVVSFKSASPSVAAIIKKSLKKELRKKLKKEKEKRGVEEMKEIRRQEIWARDQKIREENSRVKQVKFNPKYCWGVDQSRLKDRRRSEKDMPKRPKSSERVATCLKTIKEIQIELGVSHFRSRSLSQKSDSDHTSKKNWTSNAEVRAFMKKQDQCRKQKKIYENLHRFAEESRRKAQLQRLQGALKPAKKKQAKKLKKAHPRKPQKKNLNIIIKEDSLEDQKSLSFVYDSNRKESENIDLKIPDLSKISGNSGFDRENSSDYYKSKSESKSESESEGFDIDVEELKHYAATKIQAHIRRWLVQKRLERDEDFDSIDEQVKHITDGLKQDEKKKIKGLKIDLPSDSESGYSYNNSQFEELSDKSYQIQVVPNPEEELKRQLVWREAQMVSLESLRKKEIRDMHILAQKVGKTEELSDMLSSMVEKRYNQISDLFQQNLKDVQDKLEQDLDTEEREKLQETLDEKREEFSRLIEEDSGLNEFENENYSKDESENDFKDDSQSFSKHQSENENYFKDESDDYYRDESGSSSENRPAIYKPKSFEIAKEGFGSYESEVNNFVKKNEEIEESESEVDESPTKGVRAPEDFYVEDTSFDLKKDNFILNQPSEGPSHTPDYIPTRPNAPLEYFMGDPLQSSPEIQTSDLEEEKLDMWFFQHPNTQSPYPELTPELVNTLAESILFTLLDGIKLPDPSHQPPSFQLNIVNIENSASRSSSSGSHIQTDSVSIRTYVEKIFLRTDLKDLQDQLKIPLKKKPLEVLTKMQEIEIGTMTESDFFVYPEILRVNLYIEIESRRESATHASVSSNTDQFGLEAEHIHNKMIFDATNEALQKFRPYGLVGLPMPWSSRKKWVGSGKSVDKIVREVTEIIVEASMVQAGKISTEDMLMSNGILDEELMQHVREERLGSMLADETIEKDELWINYEFEETQVKLDLADMILECMAEETMNILQNNN